MSDQEPLLDAEPPEPDEQEPDDRSYGWASGRRVPGTLRPPIGDVESAGNDGR